MTKIRLVFLTLLAALLVAPLTAQAQPWTAAAHTADIDEQSLGIFQVSPGILQYNSSGSTSSIVAYFNVTDTTATGAPSWTTIELRYYDPSPSSSVEVRLQRHTAGSITSNGVCFSVDSSLITTMTCSIPTPVNFNAGYLYSVLVSVSRSSTGVNPMFLGVRLY